MTDEQAQGGLRAFIEHHYERGTMGLADMVAKQVSLKEELADLSLIVNSRRRVLEEMKAWLEANP